MSFQQEDFCLWWLLVPGNSLLRHEHSIFSFPSGWVKFLCSPFLQRFICSWSRHWRSFPKRRWGMKCNICSGTEVQIGNKRGHATFMSLFDLFQSLPLLNHENLGRNLQTLFLSTLMEQLQVAKRKLQGLMLRKVLEKIGIHHNPSSFDGPEHHPWSNCLAGLPD